MLLGIKNCGMKFIVFILLIFASLSHQQAADEDLYYDDYYEDEVAVDGSTASAASLEPVIGFHKSSGGGIAKIVKYLVDEEYINMTAQVYDCMTVSERRNNTSN